MWVRGLKLAFIDERDKIIVSHPVWVRGLKHVFKQFILDHIVVAPRVGAWIETPRDIWIMVLI